MGKSILSFLKRISIRYYFVPDISYRGVIGPPLQGFAPIRVLRHCEERNSPETKSRKSVLLSRLFQYSLRIMREALFLHKLFHRLAAVSISSRQQIAAFGQSTYIDGFKAIFKVHHLSAIDGEDVHLL